MATSTYEQIASITLDTTTSSVTFSSIDGSYRDLVFVWSGTQSLADDFRIYFNGDTGNNYDFVRIRGDGSSASAENANAESGLKVAAGVFNNQSSVIAHIIDYSATNKFKTALVRSNSNNVAALVSVWENTNDITSLKAETETGNFESGSTFSIYGIAK